MEIIKDNGFVVVGNREIRTSDARKLLRSVREKKNACHGKLTKTANRIKLIERFINENRGKKTNLRSWMKSKGLDYRDFFRSMGYYTSIQKVVSDDAENSVLLYHRDMVYNPDAGYHLPSRKVVNSLDHNEVINSDLGMTWDKGLALYFPTTIYDTDMYSSAEGSGDRIMDIMGGYSVNDLGKLSAHNDEAEELMLTVQELFEEEFDGVEEELDTVAELENQLLGGDEHSNASGAGKNAVCRGGCNAKHPFNKGKRNKCKDDCDKKHPPTEKQSERREDREARQEAREGKRAGVKSCKDRFKAGEISKEEYKSCKKSERQAKREKIKETGGTFLVRAWKGVAKVMPITAGVRAGAILLVRKNAFGISTRLAPALVSESEARTKFTPESIVKARIGLEKVLKMWRGVGGNSDKFKENILKGWKAKPMKVSRKAQKSSFSGGSETQIYEYEFSNFAEPISASAWGAIGALGSAFIGGTVSVINNLGVKKNPYKSGQEPLDYRNAIKGGTLDAPPPDPDSPQYDPTKDEWIDPSTGRPIDPRTGEFIDDKILGMNKWLAIGIGVVLVGTVITLLVRSKGATGK